MVMERRRAAKGLRPLSLRDKEPESPYRGNSRLLAVLSLLPAEERVRTRLGGHIEHAIAYVGTALLLGLSYPAWDWKRIAAALVIYAGILDLLQNFSPGRHPAVLDWLSSSAGGPDRDHAHACGDEVWRRWRPRICDGSRPPTWHPVQAACPTLGASDPRILYTATTCQPCRSATASSSLRWFCVVCPSVLTRR
jgi:hypothetical protein